MWSLFRGDVSKVGITHRPISFKLTGIAVRHNEKLSQSTIRFPVLLPVAAEQAALVPWNTVLPRSLCQCTDLYGYNEQSRHEQMEVRAA